MPYLTWSESSWRPGCSHSGFIPLRHIEASTAGLGGVQPFSSERLDAAVMPEDLALCPVERLIRASSVMEPNMIYTIGLLDNVYPCQ